MSCKAKIITLNVVAVLLVFGLGVLSATVGRASVHHAKCMEDSPCWNWRTHGNHSRGIYATVNGHRMWCVLTVKGTGPYNEYLHNCAIAK
jgi:hypothetical protein